MKTQASSEGEAPAGSFFAVRSHWWASCTLGWAGNSRASWVSRSRPGSSPQLAQICSHWRRGRAWIGKFGHKRVCFHLETDEQWGRWSWVWCCWQTSGFLCSWSAGYRGHTKWLKAYVNSAFEAVGRFVDPPAEDDSHGSLCLHHPAIQFVLPHHFHYPLFRSGWKEFKVNTLHSFE